MSLFAANCGVWYTQCPIFCFKFQPVFQGFIHQLLLGGRIFEASKFFAFFDLIKLGLEGVGTGPPRAVPAASLFPLLEKSALVLDLSHSVFSSSELSELSASLGFPSGSFSSSFSRCSCCSKSLSVFFQ